MHTTLSAPQRSSAPPDPLLLARTHTRASLTDRIAMRIGLSLIIWGTRAPRLADDRHEHARRHHAALAREQRELAAARLALTAPHGR